MAEPTHPFTCPHDLTERETAVTADGYCPLCMAIDLRAAHEQIERLTEGAKFRLQVEFDDPDQYRRGWEAVEKALHEAGDIGLLSGNQFEEEPHG